MNLLYRFILNSSLGILELENNPVGWNAAENILDRDEEYEGVFSEYSIGDLIFPSDGYDYLKELHELEGIKLECTIELERWNQLTRSYDNIFTGNLNGREYEELSKYGRSIKIKIGESSFKESILSRKDIVINYNDTTGLDGDTLSPIAKPYIDTVVSGMEITTNGAGNFEPGTFFDFSGDYSYLVPSIVFTTNSNDNLLNTQFIPVVADRNKIADGGWLYNTDSRIATVTITIKGNYQIGGDDGGFFDFSIATKLEVATDSTGEPIESDPDYLTDFTVVKSIFVERLYSSVYSYINETFTLEIPANSALVLLTRNNFTVLTTPLYIATDNSEISLNILELPTVKTIQSILPIELFTRISESITGVLNCFSSSLVESGGDYEYVTNFNGYLARGFTDEDSQYSINFSDLAKTYKIIANAGIGIQDNIISLEPIENFYLSEISASFSDIEHYSWQRKLNKDLFYSEIESGYTKTEYEEGGGLEEYNNTSNHATVINNSKTKLSLMPKIRGDGYGITFAIDHPVGDTETTDTKYDNEYFFLDCKLSEGQLIQKGRDDFTVVNGVDQISSPINLRFTPANLIEKNSDRLSIGLQKYTSDDIKYLTSDVKTDLETQLIGQSFIIKENDNIPFSSLKAPRFSGFMLNFVVYMTPEIFQVIKNKRYERIEVKNPITNEFHYGWINKITQRNEDNKATINLFEEYNGTNEYFDNVYSDEVLDIYSDENADIYISE